jgi:CRISPR/Cas system-associated protein Cas7 (RAMP superfamily)
MYKGKGHLEDQGVDGRIILRWILRKWDAWSTDWIDLAQDRDRWRALLNAVMNLRVP